MTRPIIDIWYNIIVVYASLAFLAAAVIITATYFIRLISKRTPSDKYEFVSKYEAKYFFYTVIAIITAFAIYANILLRPLLETSGIFEVVVILIVTAVMGFAFGYVAYIYDHLVYTSIVENRLIKIRFTPRTSKSGKKMRLLTEDEEDLHLTEEMIKDEENLKYEYDVWLDETNGEKHIEKYNIHFHALVCDKCEFRTLTSTGENIEIHPTLETEGRLVTQYKCANCSFTKEVETRIPTLVRESSLV